MKWLSERKLSTKLGLAFAAVLLLTAFVGLFSINQLSKVNETTDALSTRWMPALRVIQDIKAQIARVRTRELQYIISDQVSELDKYDKVIANDLVDLKKMQDDYVKLIKTPEEREMYDNFLSMWDRYMAEDAKLRAAVRAGDSVLAKQLIRGESNKLIVALRGEVDKLVKVYDEGGKRAADFGDQVYNTSRAWIFSLLVISVVLGALGALLITRWLVNTLGGEPQYAVKLANKIAAGELNVDVVTRPGDKTSLLFAMKSMRDSLANIVGQVRHATDTIASAAQQVVAGNLDLSGRTESQASSLEETAASMEELTTTVRHNSDSARQANQLALNASSIAEQGGQVVSQVVDKMGTINESAKKISDITSVIDGIAFQTNILALNAAVEAARAGEQGRGFAVVASEVRNLAQRSASAAREIKELIGDSVDQVEAGTKLVNQAGSTMEEVVVSVRRVTDIMGEITVAGQQQSAGIVQVNEAIAQMDAVTQQNAALVEEATAASHSMQDQAASLAQLVSIFTLDGLPNHQYSAASSASRTESKPARLNRPRQ
ncbi:methyl-accepting chemotaxis protein [Pseudoduganella plicata]|uniref:Methyl-accepting chemotaxis protein n=1 Tax=Pseudoduganella plicata TaxID=321984 RepID=A0A4P7BHP1_9BURK|nr:methyl-accepting chemotaxis protein [Pseudoduganella plicata]QBQ38361.1 methyl-accepting chemotaxis protein [Pseudoduganella plicata]GGY81510.1 methyl-accepting chemotaxis protein [Pseudoduganella plicata]